MRHINTKIDSLKQYITSSKSIKTNSNGMVLDPQHGMLKFNFSSILGGNEVEFIFKRVSGNGKILILPGDGEYQFSIGSKVQQSIFLNVLRGKEIEVLSTRDTIGEVALMSASIYTNYSDENTMNWKPTLSKLEFSGLKVVGSCLFASAGASITQTSIVVTTEPPGLAVVEGGKVKFMDVCEVKEIKILETLPTIIKEIKDPFPAMTAPSTMIQPPSVIKESSSLPISVSKPLQLEAQASRDLLIYDSLPSREFNPHKNKSSNATKFITSNNQDYLLLKKGGLYSKEVPYIQPGMQYVVVINGKKLNGNGRIWVSFGQNERKEVILDGMLTERFVNVTMARQEPKIILEMMDDGVGEVIVNRIRIINGINIEEAKSSIAYSVGSNNFICVRQQIKSIISDYSIEDRGRDPIESSAMENAKFKPAITEEQYPEIDGSLFATTKSGIAYISKVQGFLPNVQILENKELITSNTLVLCSVDNAVGESIWLDYFHTNSISEASLDTLSKAKKIFTPSVKNAQTLNRLLNKKIEVKAKPMPNVMEVSVPYFNRSYCLILNRHQDAVKSLLEAWNDTLPAPAIIGCRGRVKDNVIAINEYLDYKRMLFIMRNARCLIDVRADCSDYLSGWQSLAKQYGIPIVTNDWSSLASNATLIPNWRSREGIVTAITEACRSERLSVPQPSFRESIKQLIMS